MTPGHLPPALVALRRLSAVAVLLGLLAMHGFAPHGAAHAGHLSDTSSAMSMSSPHPATPGAADAPMGAVAATSGDRARATGGSLHALAAMCLAVLLVGLVVALRPDSGVATARRAVVAWRAGRRPARARRDRPPPWLFALSIQRC